MIKLDRLDFQRPILIAEIGGNHNGDFSYALELAGLAAKNGADVVKFQTYSADGLVNGSLAAERHEHFRQLELPMETWEELANRVRTLDTEWMTSLWDIEMISVIEPLIPAFKIGSGDFTNFPLLKKALETRKPLIMSTAMCNEADVRRTVDFLLQCEPDLIDRAHLALLQCSAIYDNPENPETDLAAMISLRDLYPGIVVGYSDHFVGLDACQAALALGAQIIEVHFTTDRSQGFRDHRLSVLPDELQHLRSLCELVPQLVGQPRKRVQRSEEAQVQQFRRGTYACRDLVAGTIVQESDLCTLRPEMGIPAWQFYDLVGRRTVKPIKALEPLSWDCFDTAPLEQSSGRVYEGRERTSKGYSS
jgi:N,N'-diacetyllegionaminate synthase